MNKAMAFFVVVLLAALAVGCKQELPVSQPADQQYNWQVWKTIKLGVFPPGLGGNFHTTLDRRGMKVGHWADRMLDNVIFTYAKRETAVNLVQVTIAELGFGHENVTTQQIYARAKERGLDICPTEVAPQLRLQYEDQPEEDWLVVATEHFAFSAAGGDLQLFEVKHTEDGLWLDSFCDARHIWPWNLSTPFVFVLPGNK